MSDAEAGRVQLEVVVGLVGRRPATPPTTRRAGRASRAASPETLRAWRRDEPVVGGPGIGVVVEVARPPGRGVMGGLPPAVAAVRALLVVLDQPHLGQLAEVVAGGAAVGAEPAAPAPWRWPGRGSGGRRAGASGAGGRAPAAVRRSDGGCGARRQVQPWTAHYLCKVSLQTFFAEPPTDRGPPRSGGPRLAPSCGRPPRRRRG